MTASSSGRSVPRGSIAVHFVRQVLSLPEIQIEFLGVEAVVLWIGEQAPKSFLVVWVPDALVCTVPCDIFASS